MKNLTEKQETILAEITNEFIKINEEKATRKRGGLLDVDELLTQRDNDRERKKQIEIENKIAKEKFYNAIKTDIDRLNEDLQHINLYADYCYTDDKKRYGINIIGRAMNLIDFKDILSFEYTQDYKHIGFKSEIGTIYKFLDTYTINFYYGSTRHNNIESALKSEHAERYIKNLLNQANK